ncbi:hypothetical protein PYR74_11300 [Acinetobacter bereziniae]|nr:hypothetical protein PYR74_11300 [Acinetobacter bereziniae]
MSNKRSISKISLLSFFLAFSVMSQAEESKTVTKQVQATKPDIAQLKTQADKGQAKAQYQLFCFIKTKIQP